MRQVCKYCETASVAVPHASVETFRHVKKLVLSVIFDLFKTNFD